MSIRAVEVLKRDAISFLGEVICGRLCRCQIVAARWLSQCGGITERECYKDEISLKGSIV